MAKSSERVKKASAVLWAYPSSLAWTTRNVLPSQSGRTYHIWKQFKKILEGTVLDPAGYVKHREISPVSARPPQRVSQGCLQKGPAIYHPSGEAGVCLALGPPVNDCHMHLIATPTRAPYLPAQGYKPDSLITTGPSGSLGPVTTSTGNEATWKRAQRLGGGRDGTRLCLDGPGSGQAGCSLDAEFSKC